jgi:hypothetical protein
MGAKKPLNDAAFSLMIDDLTPILHILGVSYNEIGELYYPGRNHPGKMYHLIWRRQHIPLRFINILIKMVSERSYRIAWERLEAARQLKLEQTPGYKKPEEKKQEVKPDEPKKLIPKKIQEVESKKLKVESAKQEPEKIEPVKIKQKYKKRTSKPKPEIIKIEKKPEPVPEPKKIEPVNLQDGKKKSKTIFEKLGKPLSDFKLKK